MCVQIGDRLLVRTLFVPGGLEVLSSETGAWIEAPPTSDTVLCNTGDFMQLWTEGKYPSTKHRVVHWKDNHVHTRTNVDREFSSRQRKSPVSTSSMFVENEITRKTKKQANELNENGLTADDRTLRGRISVVFFYSPNYDAPARSLLRTAGHRAANASEDITWCGDKIPFVG